MDTRPRRSKERSEEEKRRKGVEELGEPRTRVPRGRRLKSFTREGEKRLEKL